MRTGCWVSEILFDDTVSATGVRYLRPDLTGYDTVSARREVVVTAGAIDTPKLLMLSGIGPSVHLRDQPDSDSINNFGVSIAPAVTTTSRRAETVSYPVRSGRW